MKQSHQIILASVTSLIFLFLVIHYIYPYLYSSHSSTAREGMFSPATLDKFIILQSFNNPNTYFNLQQLSKQATEEDMQYYNTHGHWYWDDLTKQAYEEDLKHNQILQEYPKGTYMKTAQNTYNQNIMKQILSWRAPEGEFLMSGVTTGNHDYEIQQNEQSGIGVFPYTSGLLPKGEGSVVCNNNQLALRKMVGNSVPVYAPLDYTLLPTLVPGFKFLKGPCDPCGALKDKPDYSCPFVLGDREPSLIWKYFWGLG
jgi:hypothetical protein